MRKQRAWLSLLEYVEGRATVNMQAQDNWGEENQGSTALHLVGHAWRSDMHMHEIEESQVQILKLLLGAGADTAIIDSKGQTAEARLREQISKRRVERPDLFAVFRQVPDSRRAYDTGACTARDGFV